MKYKPIQTKILKMPPAIQTANTNQSIEVDSGKLSHKHVWQTGNSFVVG